MKASQNIIIVGENSPTLLFTKMRTYHSNSVIREIEAIKNNELGSFPKKRKVRGCYSKFKLKIRVLQRLRKFNSN